MPGNNLIFYGTTGTGGSDGDSTPDTADWLGRHRASQTLHETQSTLTATQTDRNRHIITDSARIGDGADAHALKWILIQTGPAAMSAARVASFDTATGDFVLDRRLAANAVSGDDYAIFDTENCFPNVTEALSESGDTRYRCVFMRNEHGVSVTNVRIRIVPLMAGWDDWDRLHQAGAGAPFLTLADDTTSPLNSQGQRQLSDASDNFSGSGGWQAPLTRAQADTEDASLTNNTGLGIYLRRVVAPGSRLRRSMAFLLVADTDIAGSDPDPLIGGAIIAWDVLGIPITATGAADRHAYVSGGVRFDGLLVSANTGDPIVDRPVKFQVGVGDPGAIETTDNPVADFEETDSLGEAGATFTAGAATAGQVSDIEMLVPDGDEVGAP